MRRCFFLIRGVIPSEFHQIVPHVNRSHCLRAWFRPPQGRAGLPLDRNRSPNDTAEPPLDWFPPPHDLPRAGEDRKRPLDPSGGSPAVLADLRTTLRNFRPIVRDLRGTVRGQARTRKGLFEPPDTSARPCGNRFRSFENRNRSCGTPARSCDGCDRSCGDRNRSVWNGLR